MRRERFAGSVPSAYLQPWEEVIVRLVGYLETAPFPQPLVVANFGQTGDPRAESALLDLLRRTVLLDDTQASHLAYQAIVALTDFHDPPEEVFELARSALSAEVREFADAFA